MKVSGARLFFLFLFVGLVSTTGWYYINHGINVNTGASQSAGKNGAKGDAEVPVTVAMAGNGDIRLFLNELGTVVPRNTVTVHSRVEGQIVDVTFKEGQMVEAGDPLVELDAAPYHAQLMQAEGQMQKDRALLKEAREKLERYKVLFAQDAIAKQELDTQESLVSQYEGATRVDAGQIESANIQVNYAHITAPISGRIGLRHIDKGNIVHVGDQNDIATITELQPITVVFAIPEESIPAMLRHMNKDEPLYVEALDREEGHLLGLGRVAAVDTQIDTQTGTVKCKSEFPNKNLALFPNQFVNVRVLMEIRRNKTLVPSSAVQHGTKGSYVFLVKEDHTVTIRQIKPGIREGEKVSIDSGLTFGDTVVTDGADALREGTKITVAKDITDSFLERNGVIKAPSGKEPNKDSQPEVQP